MLHTRKEREELEHGFLAPYAARSARTRRRPHDERPHPFRTEFQRDRDRVLHSRAFRRLEYKTQVFVNGTADHYRTRMTHTIEMAAVGRTLARALRVNEDLTEAIALAHDIGHSPFGHSGEEALNELMREEGGFDHNLQSLRWVEQLEQRYPDFPGLNLTWEVRAGLRKHLAHREGETLDGYPIGPHQLMEAQIADVADDMTYSAHDVDDGLEAGVLSEEQLRQVELWRRAAERARAEFPRLDEQHQLTVTIRCLLDIQVKDVLRNSERLLSQHDPRSIEEVIGCPERLVTVSPEMRALLEPFHTFMHENMYRHPEVAQANNEAVQMMRRLFLYYVEHPEKMGRKARARLPHDGLWRTACDYVSGMTDRYAIEEYLRYGLDAEPLHPSLAEMPSPGAGHD